MYPETVEQRNAREENTIRIKKIEEKLDILIEEQQKSNKLKEEELILLKRILLKR